MLELKSNLELPESEYHSEKYADYLSGSELWAYYDDCPAEYVYGERKETKSLITGSAVHSEVLEMQSFDEFYYRGFEPVDGTYTSDQSIKDKLKAVGRTGYSTKKGMDLYNMLLEVEPDAIIAKVEIEKLALENEGKTCLPYKDYDMAKAMRKQLLNYPLYAEFIELGECESSIVGECEILGRKVKVKARPDIIYNGSIANYKTANSAKPSELVRHSYKYGYFMKEVFNALVFEQITGVFPQINILAQSKKAPYVCTMFTMTQDMIDIGMAQLEQAFALWSACKDNGVVTDYAQGRILDNLEVEPWMLKV